MKQSMTIGIDLAKSIFFVVALSPSGKQLQRKKLLRSQVMPYLANQPQRMVALEACSGAHYWAREIQALGHEVKLLPPQHGEQDGTYWLGGYCPIQALPARALHVETVRQLKVNKRQTPGCEGNQQAMTTQVNRCIENLRRVEAIKGCVLDQDDTLADLIGARSYKPHPEAGYTTDNLLLSLTV